MRTKSGLMTIETANRGRTVCGNRRQRGIEFQLIERGLDQAAVVVAENPEASRVSIPRYTSLPPGVVATLHYLA